MKKLFGHKDNNRIFVCLYAESCLILSENGLAMVSIKPIIIPSNRRKDGTWQVVIRITCRGVSRRLATALTCTSADITRTGRIKSSSPVSAQADEVVRKMRSALSQLTPFDLESMDVDAVVGVIRSHLRRNAFCLDFFGWAKEFIVLKEKTAQRAYFAAINSLARFLGKSTLDINAITKSMLMEYMAYVDSEPRLWYDRKLGRCVPSSVGKIPKAASSRHVAKLQHLYCAAQERFNDEDSGEILIPRNPFAGIRKVYPPNNGQVSIGVEVMQRVISAQTENGCERISLDLFVVSFGLMGVNLADLWRATPVPDREWHYNRQKTEKRRADRAFMKVVVPEQLTPFLSRLTGEGEWWLNTLHSFTGGGKDYATARVNRYLRRWCERNGIPVFTFGAARHTWATLARSAGVDKSTIDDCLAHKGDYAVTDIYAEKAWHLMTEANEKVLSLFAW